LKRPGIVTNSLSEDTSSPALHLGTLIADWCVAQPKKTTVVSND
jgi:hypothetical protein